MGRKMAKVKSKGAHRTFFTFYEIYAPSKEMQQQNVMTDSNFRQQNTNEKRRM
jgi:hypothetical protein